MKKSKKEAGARYMPCSGCGRHTRLVGPDVVDWFCHHCFMMNGNYNRHQKGLPLIKPLKDIKVKDVLIGADGKQYQVVGRGETLGEDKIFPVKPVGSKEIIFLGDYFFARKA